MALDGKVNAKPKRARREWKAPLATIVILILLGQRAKVYDFGYDLWSRVYIAPQLSHAEEALKAGHSQEALAEALPMLRRHPDNPRLLYFVTGIYWDLDQLPLAIFYAKAFFRSPNWKDPEQLDHLGQLFVTDERAWPYLKDARNLSCDGGYAEPNSWINSLSMSAEEKSGLQFKIMAAPSPIADNLKLFYTLPGGWRKVTVVKPAALLRDSSDVAEGDDAGYVNVDGSVLCCEDAGVVRWCESLFRKANLWEGVRTGRLKIDYPEGGDGCCTLSLDDPDLRPLDVIVAAFLARREAAGKEAPETSAEGFNSLIGLNQRVLLKQSYMLSFVGEARR